MESKITTPEQLVKNFLPDYEKKWAEELKRRPSALMYDVRVGFIEKNFSEALASYHDYVLKCARDRASAAFCKDMQRPQECEHYHEDIAACEICGYHDPKCNTEHCPNFTPKTEKDRKRF